jgi:hypothetical protein
VNIALAILVVITSLGLLAVFVELCREQKRTRVLGSFIAGLVAYELDKDVPYEQLLFYISHEFEADFWSEPALRFLKRDRNLFHSEPMGNGGFNMLFWDFFDREKNLVDIARLSDPKQRIALYEKLQSF